MKLSEYINEQYLDARLLAESYASAKPFPSIVMRDFFREEIVSEVERFFPNLASLPGVIEFNDDRQVKFACNDYTHFPRVIFDFISFLNSKVFIEYLQVLTAIERPLISDPYLNGGGLHEIKRGGMLKVHADFNKHSVLGLDRRLNLLVYLNKLWLPEFGGYFELWDNKMQMPIQKILPEFNTVAVFSTKSDTYHGHPDPLTCPSNRSRKSVALYYYTNGRPESEAINSHGTIFKERPGEVLRTPTRELKSIIKGWLVKARS